MNPSYKNVLSLARSEGWIGHCSLYKHTYILYCVDCWVHVKYQLSDLIMKCVAYRVIPHCLTSNITWQGKHFGFMAGQLHRGWRQRWRLWAKGNCTHLLVIASVILKALHFGTGIWHEHLTLNNWVLFLPQCMNWASSRIWIQQHRFLFVC